MKISTCYWLGKWEGYCSSMNDNAFWIETSWMPQIWALPLWHRDDMMSYAVPYEIEDFGL